MILVYHLQVLRMSLHNIQQVWIIFYYFLEILCKSSLEK